MVTAETRSEPDNPIDPWTVNLVRRKSGQIVRQAGLPRGDREDIEQTLMMHLLSRFPSFDPAKGEREAYLHLLLRQGTANILRSLRALKRTGTVVPLDTVLRGEGDHCLEPADPDSGFDLEERVDLVHDTAEGVGSLPPELRRIADLLQEEHSLAATARRLGIPRSSLYDRIDAIRTVFESTGLADYM